MLYIRQIIVLFVGLYTSRIILKNLGVMDFGIYNVVAGVVTILGFLSSSMTTACQRYFAYDLGIGDYKHLNIVYSTSFFIYFIISIIILIISETLGLWFVCNKLTIPNDRLNSAIFVLHISVITFITTIMTIPFTAIITAHEDMSIYAWMSIYECSIKLILIVIMGYISFDKLKVYSLILLFIPVSNFFIYQIICFRKYKNLSFKFAVNIKLLKELLGYVIWNVLSGFAGALYNQGLNFVLNIFCGPIINSARAISFQVNGAVTSFASHFSSAVQPQLIKNYAIKDYSSMYKQLYRGIKLTFFLMYIFVVPLVLEIQPVLKVWLGEYPDYTEIFIILTLCTTCIEVMTYSLDTMAQATGKIKLYQFLISIIVLLNLPLSIFLLKLHYEAFFVIIVYAVLMLFSFIIRLLMLHYILIDFKLKTFFIETILPVFLLIVLSLPLPILIKIAIDNTILQFFSVVVISIISNIFIGYKLLLNKEDKEQVQLKINNSLRKYYNKTEKNNE